MKEQLGIEKFDTVVVASGINFADALSGTYLASIKKEPVLQASETKAEAVVLTYALNFPDGLCGGTLAANTNASMILTIKGKEDLSAAYVKKQEINQGIILGGPGLLSDSTVK